MKTQSYPLSDNPDPAVIQRNLSDLFQFAHTHDTSSTPPSDADGNIGDILLINTGNNYYLYAKFSVGWKSILLS